jgi:hypothetical protein
VWRLEEEERGFVARDRCERREERGARLVRRCGGVW